MKLTDPIPPEPIERWVIRLGLLTFALFVVAGVLRVSGIGLWKEVGIAGTIVFAVTFGLPFGLAGLLREAETPNTGTPPWAYYALGGALAVGGLMFLIPAI